MCTSISYQTKTGVHFLARTMDFGFALEGQPIVMPRNHEWQSDLGHPVTSRYGYVGTGRKFGSYLFADGVNEKGVAIAELYFPDEVQYEQNPKENQMQLAPHELTAWVLGEIGSLAELKERIDEIAIVSGENALLGMVLPLHYILTDPTGETIVIESHGQGLQIKNNPVHVMTNSPELEWHLKNLNNYIGLQSPNFKPKNFGDYVARPFGQGSGTLGLPGGYTGPERFVRAAYLRQNTKEAETVEEGIINILHILENVTIPRGVNLKDDGFDDYTQYRAILNTTERIYYLNNHDTNRLLTVRLTEELLNKSEPTIYEPEPGLHLTPLNA